MPRIPRIPHSFFKWYCDSARYEELHGDLEEIFNERAKKSGWPGARLGYWLDVARCFQPYAWRPMRQKSSQNASLFRNYYKVAVRGMMKNKMNSFINIVGLSVAIGICILVYGFLQWDHNIDQFHLNKNNVYLVTWLGDQDGSIRQYGASPRPLGEMMREDMTHVRKVCRIDDRAVVIKQADNVFYENVRFVDPEFLEMFTFPLKWGSSRPLTDLNSIVLSEEMSVKYFGSENPIGKDLFVKFNNQESKYFKITGVAIAFPKAHDIEFGFLLNYQNLRVADPAYRADDWSEFTTATLIQVDSMPAAGQVERAMEKYRRLQNEANRDRPIRAFVLEQLTTLHDRAGDIRNAIAYNDNGPGRVGLSVIAGFMLALACFNYINIALVSAVRRLREIGIRKVIGANRLKMIVQFLSENLVTTFFALLFGFALSITIFIPWFVQFAGGGMQFEVFDKTLVIFLSALLVFTAIASGLYPAVYISRFEAIELFRGSILVGRKNSMTTLFLGIQIILACLLITTGVVFTQNNHYQSNLSWGYRQNETLYAAVPDSASFHRMNAILARQTDIDFISGSADHIGRKTTNAIIRVSPSNQFDADQLAVDAGYAATMAVQITEGRFFHEGSANDKKAIVINELFASNLGLKNPIGARVEIGSTGFEVIGVVKNFHSESFFNKIHPAFFRIASESDYRYLSVRVKHGTERRMYGYLREEWSKLYPEIPFQGGFQEDVWGNYFQRINRSETFSKVIASIAVLLAGMGLYGLVAINLSGRTKEFSIRKTLGAKTADIAFIVLRQYVPLIGVALILGVPASYFFAGASLNMLFAYPMPVGYGGILTAVVILLTIILIVISSQIRRAASLNPVDGLKAE